MSLPLFEQVFAGEPEPSGKPLTGAELRDSGMASVLSHTPEEFKERFAKRVEGFPRGYRFTIDRVIDDLGGRPKDVHPCAIGGLAFGLVVRGIMKRTGQTLKAERASLRRTDMPEWERL